MSRSVRGSGKVNPKSKGTASPLPPLGGDENERRLKASGLAAGDVHGLASLSELRCRLLDEVDEAEAARFGCDGDTVLCSLRNALVGA